MGGTKTMQKQKEPGGIGWETNAILLRGFHTASNQWELRHNKGTAPCKGAKGSQIEVMQSWKFVRLLGCVTVNEHSGLRRPDLRRMAMRKVLMAAILSTACVLSANAKEQTGTIVSIDNGAKTFVCEWKDKSWTYRTTSKTSFRLSGKTGTFSDLKAGVRVNVGYHTDDKGRIADWVNIEKR
jgi:hypothetical protein